MTNQTSCPLMHRRQHDGSYDSICLACFSTISSVPLEAGLEGEEQDHACSASLRSIGSRQVAKVSQGTVLTRPLRAYGFRLAGNGSTTCMIHNSGLRDCRHIITLDKLRLRQTGVRKSRIVDGAFAIAERDDYTVVQPIRLLYAKYAAIGFHPSIVGRLLRFVGRYAYAAISACSSGI